MMHELEAAWRELDDDPDVRVIVNTGDGTRVPDRRRRRAAEPRSRRAARAVAGARSDFELRFTAWHNDVWKPVIAAVNGVCAGGGLHFVADADIVIASDRRRRSSIRTCRSARSSVYETIALAKKSPMEAGAAHGVHRARTSACRRARAYELGIVREVVDPPERRCAPKPRRTLGARRDRAQRAGRPSCAAQSSVRLVGPRLENGTGVAVTYPELETLKLERVGPVGWLINNRPEQLNAMNAHDARRVRGRVADARRRSRGARDRAHRRRARVPDRRRRDRDRHRRRRACSATASRSRSGTSTSPRGTTRCGSR